MPTATVRNLCAAIVDLVRRNLPVAIAGSVHDNSHAATTGLDHHNLRGVTIGVARPGQSAAVGIVAGHRAGQLLPAMVLAGGRAALAGDRRDLITAVARHSPSEVLVRVTDDLAMAEGRISLAVVRRLNRRATVAWMATCAVDLPMEVGAALIRAVLTAAVSIAAAAIRRMWRTGSTESKVAWML